MLNRYLFSHVHEIISNTSNILSLLVDSDCIFSQSHIDQEFGELDDVEPEEDQQAPVDEDQDGTASRLWVDRFSPRHYTELLSDDVSLQDSTPGGRFV